MLALTGVALEPTPISLVLPGSSLGVVTRQPSRSPAPRFACRHWTILPPSPSIAKSTKCDPARAGHQIDAMPRGGLGRAGEHVLAEPVVLVDQADAIHLQVRQHGEQPVDLVAVAGLDDQHPPAARHDGRLTEREPLR